MDKGRQRGWTEKGSKASGVSGKLRPSRSAAVDDCAEGGSGAGTTSGSDVDDSGSDVSHGSNSSSSYDDEAETGLRADGHREQMQRMEQMFHSPFMGFGGTGGGGLLGLEDGGRHRPSRRQQQHDQQRSQNMQVSRGRHQQQLMDPFAHFNSMFSNMHSMMSDMHKAFQQGPSNDPSAHVYQQSTYYSSSNMGGGSPKVFEASSSMRQIPGGVRETRKTMRDSETGTERVALGHHINERAHIIERSRNTRTGESNENQELINLGEEDAPTFHQEYQDRWHKTMRGVEQRRRRIREQTTSHRPIQHRALPEPEGRRARKASNRHE